MKIQDIEELTIGNNKVVKNKKVLKKYRTNNLSIRVENRNIYFIDNDKLCNLDFVYCSIGTAEGYRFELNGIDIRTLFFTEKGRVWTQW